MPTARTYDFILTVADATGFVSGNNIFGVTSDIYYSRNLNVGL